MARRIRRPMPATRPARPRLLPWGSPRPRGSGGGGGAAGANSSGAPDPPQWSIISSNRPEIAGASFSRETDSSITLVAPGWACSTSLNGKSPRSISASLRNWSRQASSRSSRRLAYSIASPASPARFRRAVMRPAYQSGRQAAESISPGRMISSNAALPSGAMSGRTCSNRQAASAPSDPPLRARCRARRS